MYCTTVPTTPRALSPTVKSRFIVTNRAEAPRPGAFKELYLPHVHFGTYILQKTLILSQIFHILQLKISYSMTDSHWIQMHVMYNVGPNLKGITNRLHVCHK